MRRLQQISLKFLRTTALWCAGFAGLTASAPLAFATDVTTYHYDNQRTGWDRDEKALTPKTVLNGKAGAKFKRIASIALDEQVDAQPLIVSHQPVKGRGTHDVAYVATENNTLYAIDANSGAVLMQRNFGPAVPFTALPANCENNSQLVGINGTPVIDSASSTLYLIAYTYTNNVQQHFLHAVDLSTLEDVTPPVQITASSHLTDGSKYKFNSAVTRQRPALLLANGNVYAGFGSFCDAAADKSRGWLLGWQKDTLQPLAHNELTNKLASDPDDFFLTAIWMSGYGPAASPDSGDIYFVTGNSDYSGTTIDKKNNIAESAVQMSSDLKRVKGQFTPSNAADLEKVDADFGAGGFMLLPKQDGIDATLGLTAGKDGSLYLFDADRLGGGDKHSVLGKYGIGSCWCGQSYFTGSDGLGKVVTSGGNSVGFWQVKSGPKPSLEFLAGSTTIGGSQDPGFFTSVSSDGTKKDTAMVWAVTRPDAAHHNQISLYAFDAADGETDFSDVAGKWPNTGGNANIVPVVANGKVFVAAYKSLAIYGLSAGKSAPMVSPQFDAAAARPPLPFGVHEVFGTVRAVGNNTLTVAKRDGTLLKVDTSAAQRAFNYAEPAIGNGVQLRGAIGAGGVLQADIVLHAKKDPSMWRADR